MDDMNREAKAVSRLTGKTFKIVPNGRGLGFDLVAVGEVRSVIKQGMKAGEMVAWMQAFRAGIEFATQTRPTIDEVTDFAQAISQNDK
jgi:hypothetical protein